MDVLSLVLQSAETPDGVMSLNRAQVVRFSVLDVGNVFEKQPFGAYHETVEVVVDQGYVEQILRREIDSRNDGQ